MRFSILVLIAALFLAGLSVMVDQKYFLNLVGHNTVQDKEFYYHFLIGATDKGAYLPGIQILSPLTVFGYTSFTFLMTFFIYFLPAIMFYKLFGSKDAALFWMLTFSAVMISDLGLYAQFMVMLAMIWIVWTNMRKGLYFIGSLLLAVFASYTHRYGMVVVLGMQFIKYFEDEFAAKMKELFPRFKTTLAILFVLVLVIALWKFYPLGEKIEVFYPIPILVDFYSLQQFVWFLFVLTPVFVVFWLEVKAENVLELLLMAMILLACIYFAVNSSQMDFWRVAGFIELALVFLIAKTRKDTQALLNLPPTYYMLFAMLLFWQIERVIALVIL